MIPHVFHYIWLQGASQLPLAFQDNLRQCQHVNHATVRIWDEHTIHALLSEHEPELLPYFMDTQRPFAQRSDIARYVILYVHGGIYVDTDYVCSKPLRNLLSDQIDLFYIPFSDITGERVMNGLFGAAPRHPALHQVIHDMKQRLKEGGIVTYTTGTGMFQTALQTYHDNHPRDTRYLLIAQQQLFPCNVWKHASTCEEKYKSTYFMSHHNHGSWNPIFAIIKWVVRYPWIIPLVMLAVLLLWRKSRSIQKS